MKPVLLFFAFAFAIGFVTTGYLQQKTLDDWNRDAGRAAMVNSCRGDWARYMRANESDLPNFVRKRITRLGRIGNVALLCLLLLLGTGLRK
jgi:hypothetical protein